MGRNRRQADIQRLARLYAAEAIRGAENNPQGSLFALADIDRDAFEDILAEMRVIAEHIHPPSGRSR